MAGKGGAAKHKSRIERPQLRGSSQSLDAFIFKVVANDVMSEARAGYIELNDKFYKFDDASCHLSSGFLSISARGTKAELGLVGVPFAGAASYADLPGRTWEPDDQDMSQHADTFAEGGLRISGHRISVFQAKVMCKTFNKDTGVLKISIELEGDDDEGYGFSGHISGMLACVVESR